MRWLSAAAPGAAAVLGRRSWATAGPAVQAALAPAHKVPGQVTREGFGLREYLQDA